WIYTIARNEVIDYYRTRHPAEEVPEDLQDNSVTEEEILENETLDELAKALELLDARERELIVLHYYKNETLRRIAEMMKLSYDQTKNIHYKALKHMRNLLGPDR
ncbi:MAG: sigma-70 family RNA polymerase sigma factor, partial [Lachnospiraceae bacterium]|nr:sigma-70 family RNA polymerase sigma factor [Lachnospiraceae bacterium]